MRWEQATGDAFGEVTGGQMLKCAIDLAIFFFSFTFLVDGSDPRLKNIHGYLAAITGQRHEPLATQTVSYTPTS